MTPGKDYIGVGCGALIVNNKNETLLIKRGNKSKNEVGFWGKPGGAVEFGEKVEDAVRREIKEELDIDVELTKFLGFTDHIIKSDNQHWLTLSYLAKIVGGEPKNMEPEKTEAISWFNFNNLPKNLNQPAIDSIKEYLKSFKLK